MRFQLALNVRNLDEAIPYYSKLLGAPVNKRKPGYANFAVDSPPIKLVLFEAPEASERLNHVGFGAQSVFSHLREPHISECFDNIRNIMTKESRFFFTFYEANSPHVLGYKSFAYSFDSLKQMATDSEFVLSRHPEYAHPRGQVMIEARPAES